MYRLLFIAAFIIGVICWFKSVSNIRKHLAEKKKKVNEVNNVD